MVFVPGARESIVDLRSARSTLRKLHVAELDARTEIATFLSRANEQSRRHELVFDLESLRTPGFPDVRPQFDWTVGDQSLFAALLVGDFIAGMLARWKPVSLSHVARLTTTSDDELTRGLALLSELGVSIVD